MLLTPNFYLNTCYINEHTRFPQIAIKELVLCVYKLKTTPHIFIYFYKAMLDALLVHELISDLVFMKQFLKIDFEPLKRND